MIGIRADGSLLADEPPPAGKIRIAQRAGEDFASIQAAIDAAADGATLLIGPGRYDERLKITRPVKLLGAGPDQTVIGPSADARDRIEETFEERIKALVEQFKGKPIDGQKVHAAWAELAVAVVKIDGVQGVELRSLRIVSPGTPRTGGGLSDGFHGIDLSGAGLQMTNCAAVGCLGSGIHATGKSNLEIDDCLIAGCWSPGIQTKNFAGRLKIANSDIRNCYHYNVWVGTSDDVFTIEGCRVSGSAWSGIRFGGRPTIARNAIFENARAGIYADGDAAIKQNLIYKNGVGGVIFWSQNKSVLEGNLLMENGGADVFANGVCEPTIRRNVFVGGKVALLFGPVQSAGVSLQPSGKYQVEQNLFWKTDRPLVRRYPESGQNDAHDDAIPLAAGAGNQSKDPQVSIDSEGQVALAADSPARQLDFAGITAATMKSRWPLTLEERGIIPDDGSRDWSKWKMKPALAKQ
jgi:hypothetical protein